VNVWSPIRTPLLASLITWTAGSSVWAIEIASPTSGASVRSGALVTFQARPSPGEQLESVLFVTSEGTVPAGPGYTAQVKIPDGAVGAEIVLAVATVVGRGQAMSFVEVNADPGPLARLLVSAPRVFTVVGERASLDVKGVFDDDVVRDLGGPDRGSTYASSDDSVIAVSPLGLIQARKRGTAEIRVSNRERTASTSVYVAVADPPDNAIPVPDAGQDLVVGPETMVRLSAAGSHDQDGDELRYRWSQLKGPYVFLWDADTATPHFVSPKVSAEAVVELSLAVEDSKGATSFPVTLRVTVRPGVAPPPPTPTPPPVGD
jgi:hypothetical protein